MSKRFFGGLVVVALLLSSLAYAEAGIKIGTVNFQQALNDVEQGKKAKSDLKAEFDAKQKKLDLQQDELKKLRDELDKQKLVLSQADLQSKEQSFSKKYMDLQKNFADYRQEIAQKEGQFTATIIKNMKELCADLGKKEGFQLIVETSQDAVLFADAKEDLTGRLVKSYNQKYKEPLKLSK